MTGAGLHINRFEHGGRMARVAARAPMLGLMVGLLLSAAACTPMGNQSEGPQTSTSAGEATQGPFTGVEMSLWKSGQEAERNNQYDLAAGAFLNLYNRYPDNVAVVTALMRNLRYAGKATDAVRLIEGGSADLLDDVDLQFEYAKSLLAAGHKARALKTFQEVAAVRTDDWHVYSAMGIAFDAHGQYGAAIGAYQHALTLSPDNPVVFNNLAMSQAMSGQLQLAISTLETAAGYNRSNPHIRQNLALLYAINGEEDKAKALAAMDLNSSDLENNLTFYRRFEGDRE